MSTPVQGWYPDPSDNRRQRYWNGTSWEQPQSQAPQAKVDTSYTWAIIAFLIAAIMFAFVNSPDDKPAAPPVIQQSLSTDTEMQPYIDPSVSAPIPAVEEPYSNEY
jgi:Protein of unknown function (DUF2510)